MILFLRLFFMYFAFTTVATETYSCLSNTTCGCSKNFAVLSRIVGGEPVKTDTWGWAVSICVRDNHICGGSLISSTLIVTAAHCLTSITSPSSLRINVGSKYLSNIRQQRSVSNIYIHHNYDTNTFINDIAIIRLESSINMTDQSTALICLPSTNDTEYPSADETVVAIGWGILSSDDTTPSNILQQVTLNIIPNSVMNCDKILKDNNLQFCAGILGGGKGIEK